MTQQRTFPENVSQPTIPVAAIEAASAAIQVRLDQNVYLSDLARAALEAAAPHLTGQRTIDTVAELDALPAGTVLRDDNGRLWEWEHIGYGGVDKALSAMGIGSMLAPSSFRNFPATVLHEPTVKP